MDLHTITRHRGRGSCSLASKPGAEPLRLKPHVFWRFSAVVPCSWLLSQRVHHRPPNRISYEVHTTRLQAGSTDDGSDSNASGTVGPFGIDYTLGCHIHQSGAA